MDRIVGATLALVFALPLVSAALAGQDRPATPTDQYKALLKEYQEAQDVFSKAYVAVKTDEERKKLLAERAARLEKVALRFLEIAQKHPTDPIAVDALLWVVNNTSDSTGDKERSHAKALARLVSDHLRSDKLGQVCQLIFRDFGKDSESFLRMVLEKSPHKEAQGSACLALARFLNSRLERVELLQGRPETVTLYERLFGKDYIAELQRHGRAKVVREVEALLERAADKYGDVKMGLGPTIGQEANVELFELRHLAVGKEAPDIQGEDQDGKTFKLSDYRGKVVLLDFWSEF